MGVHQFFPDQPEMLTINDIILEMLMDPVIVFEPAKKSDKKSERQFT